MTQQATERSAEVFWARAIGGTVLGIIIGTFNRAIVADLLATRMFGQFLGFGVGGLVAGAIQGAFLRRHIHSRWMWIALSSTGWLMLGIPEVWFPPNSLWYWACNHLVRYALLGALGGAVVGGIQSFAFWQYPRIARWWIVMHALVWAGLLLFSIFFDSLLPGEGGCYY